MFRRTCKTEPRGRASYRPEPGNGESWGDTEKNIHRIFEVARKKPPSIIFIDDLVAQLLKIVDF